MRIRSVVARRLPAWVALLALLLTAPPAADHSVDAKFDALVRERAHAGRGASQIILRTTHGSPVEGLIRAVGGVPGRYLAHLGAQVAHVPDAALHRLAGFSQVAAISFDRPVHGTMERAGVTIGARWVQQHVGFDGTGIGIVTIDSGVTPWHDDLTGRVVEFVDFVDAQPSPYDDYGHGTHVAGIIAGTGLASDGARRGIAPGASLIVLKALDATGGGHISNVIAALDYAIANRHLYNIRVINLSVAAGVHESCYDDPLTLAARRAVEAGIVVVAAAGNLGRSSTGATQYGGITAPGNAPWVLTVGASSDMGTPDRADDRVAPFSSRGPTAVDLLAKPDLVAPGVRIASITEPSSALFAAHSSGQSWGTATAVTESYLSLSGTSMAAPLVAGTVALMLQANPSLTPNAVKAILQFTAETRTGYDHLTQGAGFLNARGAVELASAAVAAPGSASAWSLDPIRWNRHIIWGGHRIELPGIAAQANAWSTEVTWGASTTPAGDPVTLGPVCDSSRPDCSSAGTCDAGSRDCGSSPGHIQRGSSGGPFCKGRPECQMDFSSPPIAHAAAETAHRAQE